MKRPILALGILAAGLIPVGPSHIAQAAEQPNIVYILADDLGYADLSCYGQEKFQTPEIDRLAAAGLRFTQHYSGSTVCAPSRCSLLTGLHPGHAQIRGNKPVQPIGQFPLEADTLTVASLLQDHGYATGAFGKWGLGYPGSSGDPLNQGFDTFFGYNCQRNAHNYYPDFLYEDDRRMELDGETYSHDLIVDRALAFIRENRDRPFFCFLPVAIPHSALQAPPDTIDRWREVFPEFDPIQDDYTMFFETTVTNPVAAYAAMVTRLDRDVGRVVDLLDELGIREDTLVLFSSDNGPADAGGNRPAFWDSNGPFRGIKRDLYDGGIRVPMIAYWPGVVPAGKVTDHLSAQWDLLPTVADLIGAEIETKIDGLSLLPTLTGQAEAQVEHDYLYWEFDRKGGRQAIRKGPWKAVRYNTLTDPDAPIEIYHVEADPGENHDFAKDLPELTAEMAALFEEARVPNPHFPIFPEESRASE